MLMLDRVGECEMLRYRLWQSPQAIFRNILPVSSQCQAVRGRLFRRSKWHICCAKDWQRRLYIFCSSFLSPPHRISYLEQHTQREAVVTESCKPGRELIIFFNLLLYLLHSSSSAKRKSSPSSRLLRGSTRCLEWLQRWDYHFSVAFPTLFPFRSGGPFAKQKMIAYYCGAKSAVVS